MTTTPLDRTVSPLTLEAAQVGSLATSPHFDTALIKEPGTGTPWTQLNLPAGEKPKRMTNYCAAKLGYVPIGELVEEQKVEPGEELTTESLVAQVSLLRGDGWALGEIAQEIGVSRHMLYQWLKGRKPQNTEAAHALLALPTTLPHGYEYPTTAERVEDLEFLLDAGVPPGEALNRCGWRDAHSVRFALNDTGRHDLLGRIVDLEDTA